MAITNAQQYQQLVKKDANGKRPGYRGIGGYQSGRSAPTSSSRSTSSRNTAGPGDTGGEGGNRPSDQSDTQSRAVDRSSDTQNINQLKLQNRYVAEEEDLLPGDTLTPEDIKLNKREQEFQNFLNRRNKVNLFGTGRLLETPAQKFSDYSASVNRPFFENVVRSGKIPGVNFATLEDEDDYEKAYQNYMSDRLAGNIDAYGNPLGGNYYDSSGQLVVTDTKDDGAGQKILPEDIIGDTEEEVINPRDYTGLAPRFMGSIFDFSGPQFAAEGGIARTGAMDGGRMRQMEMMQDEDDPTGGIMDLESGRQMYFLGKLVKKAGRAIKKVVKSPIGKAALMYGLGSLGAGFLGKAQASTGSGIFSKLKTSLIGKLSGGEGNIFKGGKFSGLANFLRDQYTSDGGKLKFGLGLGLGVPFALDMMGVGKDKDEGTDLDEYYKAQGIDIDRLRYAPYRTLAPSIIGSNYQTGIEGRKDGGRMGYQEGGDAEPVAKKTMPLIDMDGKEKDYRETGGFVDIGRMERADDVPARLSKNEFVFTADAVRNAGEGDIDKGAEVMYNMMKNLESGGEVSEESQGLDGAREMFQTSKRLEEVL